MATISFVLFANVKEVVKFIFLLDKTPTSIGGK